MAMTTTTLSEYLKENDKQHSQQSHLFRNRFVYITLISVWILLSVIFQLLYSPKVTQSNSNYNMMNYQYNNNNNNNNNYQCLYDKRLPNTNHSFNNLQIHCQRNTRIEQIPSECAEYEQHNNYIDINTVNTSECFEKDIYDKEEWNFIEIEDYFKSFISFLKYYYSNKTNKIYDINILNKSFNIKYHSPGLSVIITTYDRYDLVLESIKRLLICHQLIRSIHIIWNNLLISPTDEWYLSLNKLNKLNVTEIHIHLMDENNLSNRFYPFFQLKSNFIFSIDDDELIKISNNNAVNSCSFIFINFMIQHFYPNQIIGNKLIKRCIICNRDGNGNKYKYEYANSKCKHKYNLMITGFAFLNKCMFYMYFNEKYSLIRKYIADTMNGEDIAFNFIVSKHTNKPPLYLDFNDIMHLHQKGVSKLNNTKRMFDDQPNVHMEQRSKIAHVLVEKYGYYFKHSQLVLTIKNIKIRNQMFQQYLTFITTISDVD